MPRATSPRKVRETGYSVRTRYLVSLGGRVVGAIAQTAAVAFIARSLGTEDFASYGVLFSVCQVVVVVLELGFMSRVLRLGVEAQPRGVLGALLVARGVVVLVLIAIASAFVQSQPARSGVIWAVVVAVSGDALGDLAVGVLQGERRSFTAVWLLVGRRLVALLPFVLGLSYEAAVSSLVVSGAAGWVSFLAVVGPRAGRPAPIRTLVRENGPLGLTGAATGLTQGDTAVVSAVSGSVLVASYAAAARLANPINLAVATLLQVVIPELANLDGTARYATFVRARRVVALIAAMLAVSSTLSPMIVHLLYGEEFADAAPILAGVLVGAGISAVAQIHLAWLVVDGLRFRVPLQLLVAIPLGLIVLLIAVQVLGPAGAAIGIISTQAMIALVVVGEWLRTTRTFRKPLAV